MTHPLQTTFATAAGQAAWEERLRDLFERRELHARFASADAREGMQAFLDKRKPAFQHR